MDSKKQRQVVESSRGQMLARGGNRGETTDEDYSAIFSTANEMRSTPLCGVTQEASNSAYSMPDPAAATEQEDPEGDDVTQETQKKSAAKFID